MANQYFKNFPEIQYKIQDSNGVDKFVTIKDFFRKSRIEQAAVTNVIDYTYYELEDGERPDVAATKLYGNPDLHWTFFLVNEIENYYDWHRDNNSFEVFMSEKYPGQILKASATTDIVSATSKFLIGERLAFQYEFEYSNDTSFSGTDENGKTLSFQEEGLKVYRVDVDTGIKILLQNPSQYTISNLSNYRYTTLTYVETNPILKTGDKLLINDSIKANVIKVEPTFKRIVTVGHSLVGGQRITGSVSGKTFTIVDAINHRDGIRHYKSEAGHYRNTFTSGDISESHYKHEIDKNEEKRRIKVIRPEFIKRVVNEFERIMLS
jgi:hypothetical protein